MIKTYYLAMLAIICNSALLFSNEISTALEYKKQPFDVINYNVKAEILNPASKYIQAQCDISIDLMHESTQDKFFFHLMKLSIDSCKIKDELVYPIKEIGSDNVEYYSLPVANYTDKNIVLSIFYSGIMDSEKGNMDWGGIHYQDSILFNMGVGFNNTQVSAASYWFPCYDHPSDKALYKLRFTVPEEYKVAASGNLLIEEAAGDNKITYRWTGDVKAATYMIGFAISKFDQLSIAGSSVPNMIFSPTNKTKACTNSLKLIPKMLDCYTSVWGDYPFEKVGYVITPIGSMEHQGMIALAKNSVILSDTLNSTAAHELSHSWFGGSITPMDFRDAWLNEAFATYSEALWSGYLYGSSAYLAKVRELAMMYHGEANSEGVMPLYNFPRTGASSNYPNTIYHKGAGVVHQLRYELGDTVFFKAMRNYLQTYKNSNASTLMFKESIEKFSGRDLSEFFNIWVYGYGYPIINTDMNIIPYPDGKYSKCIVKISQVQDNSWGVYKNFAFEINFKLSDTEFDNRGIIITAKEQTVELDSVPQFTRIFYNLGKISANLAKLSKNTSNVEQYNYNNINVYPNPSSEDYINILNNSELCGEAKIEIYSNSGELIRQINIGEVAAYQNISQINISGISSDQYFLKLIIGDSEQVSKFDINK